MQQKTRWMALWLAAGLCSGTAAATTITSLNMGETWLGNIVSGSEVDVVLTTSNPWNNQGFTFSSPNGDVRSTSIVLSGITPTPGLSTSTSHQITITTPPAGDTAIHLSVYNKNGSFNGGGTLGVLLSDNEAFTLPAGGIFWFASSDPITSVTISSNNEPFVAQLSYAESVAAANDTGSGTGSPSPVPEPATILLVSGGALIFLGARRRWFSRQA